MLWDKVLNKNYFVDCEESNWQAINIGQIISDVAIKNAAEENKDNNLFKQLKEMGMSINQIINTNNNNNQSSANASTDVSVTNTVTITINNMLGEVQNLKEDFEDEKEDLLPQLGEKDYNSTLKDIDKAETAVQQLEEAQKQNKELPARSKSRLKRLIEDIGNEDSALHKGIKKLRRGRDYAVQLAEYYNSLAQNTGMPSVPPLALEVIKKL